MLRKNVLTPAHHQPITFTVMFNKGGLGDCIARLTPIPWMLSTYKHLSIRLLVPDYFFSFAQACFEEQKERERIEIIKFSDVDENKGFLPGALTDPSGGFTSMRMHLVDQAFITMADTLLSPGDPARNYIQLSPRAIILPVISKYVVITPNFTAKVREWPEQEVEKTIIGLQSRGYTVVILGRKDVGHTIVGKSSQFNLHGAIDLRDQTTLEEAHSIMYYAEAVLGVDNGLLHLAGMTPTPIVAGYTTVKPEFRIPIRPKGETRVIGSRVECRFCQTNLNFVYGWDFRRCLYGDYNCTKDMTAKRFLKEFDMLIKT